MVALPNSVLLAVLVTLGVVSASPIETSALEARDKSGNSLKDAIEHPMPKFNKDNEETQALRDFDCYVHLCKDASMAMRHWTDPEIPESQDGKTKYPYNRSKFGNNAAHNAFSNKNLPDGLKLPPGHDDWTSPEEWPPASALEGGRTGYLSPMHKDAQSEQGKKMRTFWSKTKKVELKKDDFSVATTMKDQSNIKSEDGTWVRLTEFQGTTGPYCKELNSQLKKYSDNFNEDTGVIKNKPAICTDKNQGKGPWGYDVGQFCWAWNGNNYVYAGK